MCATCRMNWHLASEPTTSRLASNYERHSFLLRCGVCGQLYEWEGETRQAPTPLTAEEARALFPGAVSPGDEADGEGPRL